MFETLTAGVWVFFKTGELGIFPLAVMLALACAVVIALPYAAKRRKR